MTDNYRLNRALLFKSNGLINQTISNKEEGGKSALMDGNVIINLYIFW